MSEETKSKIRIFLPFSWFIPAVISFGVINYHQLSAGIPPIAIWLMSSHIPEFYEAIVEASKRGELWGLDQFTNNSKQLEINFDHSVYK